MMEHMKIRLYPLRDKAFGLGSKVFRRARKRPLFGR